MASSCPSEYDTRIRNGAFSPVVRGLVGYNKLKLKQDTGEKLT